MSTLAVVEEVLRETGVPMTVKEIVAQAGVRLPSKSKTPDTVVARDLSMDLKKKREGSRFLRPAPGKYTLRAVGIALPAAAPTPVLAAALRSDRAPTLAARTSGGSAASATPPARQASRLAGSR